MKLSLNWLYGDLEICQTVYIFAGMDFTHDIFISYSSSDSKIAEKVCRLLEDRGMKCWIAPRDVVAGADYSHLIEKAILHAKVFVLLCSGKSMQSRWVKGELNVAFNEGKKIIPLRVDDSELEGAFRLMINQMHVVQMDESFSEEVSVVLSSVRQGSDRKKNRMRSIIWTAVSFLAVVLSVVVSMTLLTERNSVEHSVDVLVEETDSTVVLTAGGQSLKMIPVEPGTFMMGVDDFVEQDPKPMHEVTISQRFYLAETEITQGFWKAVMGHLPCDFTGPRKPVEGVSWNDCMDFIAVLSELCERTFRLPTEAEWEYAAKGGPNACDSRFSGSDNLNDVAWYGRNSGGESSDVKSKLPNSLGFYDMTGNVSEWCQDWYGTYEAEAQVDPLRDVMQKQDWSYRVIRGGDYLVDNPSRLQNFYRSCNNASVDVMKNNSSFPFQAVGLRLVMK